jgi:hypothetical protein
MRSLALCPHLPEAGTCPRNPPAHGAQGPPSRARRRHRGRGSIRTASISPSSTRVIISAPPSWLSIQANRVGRHCHAAAARRAATATPLMPRQQPPRATAALWQGRPRPSVRTETRKEKDDANKMLEKPPAACRGGVDARDLGPAGRPARPRTARTRPKLARSLHFGGIGGTLVHNRDGS